MKIQKRGIIYAPDGGASWRIHYAILPTPVHLKEKGCIRIYFGITDSERFGRTTFIDVSENNPSEIITPPTQIVLDIGVPGTFDDSGVVPSSIVVEDDHLKLYYVGFQRSFKVPYTLFSGLALGNADYTTFRRYSEVPVIDRNSSSPYSNGAPFVMRDGKLFKMWFWEGEKWVELNNKKYIQAIISYAESYDGYSWNVIKRGCIRPNYDNEFSLGRPWVVKCDGFYRMFYSVRFIDKLYRLGYAESADGITWERKDFLADIDVSDTGWDSEMICYPAVLKVGEKTYLFYNGNNNGESGFGYAEIEDF